MRFFLILLVITGFLTVSPAEARLYREKAYQGYWCVMEGGVQEFVLPDMARVDCLTRTHAVEVDFASKWAEAVGQALYYSKATGKEPGILLIMERDGDERFLERMLRATEGLGVRVWTIRERDIEVSK